MIRIRKSQDRGRFDHGWLDTRHTFSFASYYDPNYMGFRTLRVINEDIIQAGEGFGTHPHSNMEIITYMVAGHLAHRDSMDHVQVISRGGVQVMSAGTGIFHSEYNHSDSEAVHLLQIWITPARRDIVPRYVDAVFDDEAKRDTLRLIVSGDGRDGSLMIHQDVNLYASMLTARTTVSLPLGEKRSAWIQVISGEIRINGTRLNGGDGAAISEEQMLEIVAESDSEFLLFDLA